MGKYGISFFENYKITLMTAFGEVTLRVCSKEKFDRLITSAEYGDESPVRLWEQLCREYSDKKTRALPPAEAVRALGGYITEIYETVQKYKEQLMVPECSWISLDDGTPCMLNAETCGDKTAGEYAGMSITEVRKLNYLVYRLLLADAVKYNLGKSKKGVEYLNGAYEEMFKPFDRREFLKGG